MHTEFLFVANYYPEFLKDFYASDESLTTLPYEQQLARLFDASFGVGDAYLHGLAAHGVHAQQIIVNANPLQDQWAREHGLVLDEDDPQRRQRIVAAQVEHHHPDVLYVLEWCPFDDRFLASLKSHARLLVGQISSPLREDRTYAAYDAIISSWPPIVDFFRVQGMNAYPLKLAFDERILTKFASQPPKYDVSFVGGFAPSHLDRVEWLEHILDELDVDVFGYGVDTTPADSPIRTAHRGQVWGWDMYRVLAQSRVTLNSHATIDVRGHIDRNVSANMRLYEATGMGACLVTEAHGNLFEMFDAEHEVSTYQSAQECVSKVRELLGDEARRKEIAAAGQQRTLRDHTYSVRMGELLEILHTDLLRTTVTA